MPLVPMRLLLDHAAENDYGLAAFVNVDMLDRHLLLAFATVPIEGLD